MECISSTVRHSGVMANVRWMCWFLVLVGYSGCAIVGTLDPGAAASELNIRSRRTAVGVTEIRPIEGLSPTCLIFGGHHYATFDRQLITYRGTCKHLLVGTDQFQVYARNVADESGRLLGDESVSAIRYVEVAVCEDVVRIESDATSNEIVPVKVSLRWTGAPSFGYKTQRIPSNGTCYRLDYIGNSVQLETSDGVQVRFNGLSLAAVQLPGNFSGKFRGICGNNNENATDDLTTSDGMYVGNLSASNADVFIGNSYVVLDDEMMNVSGCSPPSDETPNRCQMSNATASRCSSIVNSGGPFGKCIAIVGHNDAQLFFDSCVIDACRYGESSICANLEVFAAECSLTGVRVTWRKATNCPMSCPNGTIPLTNVPPCQSTCEDPLAVNNCRLPAGEKCRCPAGMTLFGGQCVSCCGCIDDGGHSHSSGTSWTDVDCINRTCTAVKSQPIEPSSPSSFRATTKPCVSALTAVSMCTAQQMCKNGTCTAPYMVFPQPDCSLGYTDGGFCPWTSWSECVDQIQTRTRSCACPAISCCGEYDSNDISKCIEVLRICGIDPSVFGLCPARHCVGQPLETRSCPLTGSRSSRSWNEDNCLQLSPEPLSNGHHARIPCPVGTTFDVVVCRCMPA